MKVPPTPTSPKAKLTAQSQALEALYRDESLQTIATPTGRSFRISFGWLAITVVLALAAGVVGQVVAVTYIMPELLQGTPSSVVVGGKRATQRSQDAEVIRTMITTVGNGSISLYPAHKTTSTVDGSYVPAEQLASALVLSDDGWAVTTQSALNGRRDIVAVTADRKVLPVTTVVNDPATGLAFLKADGKKLSVLTFSETESLTTGQTFFAFAATPRGFVGRFRSVRVETAGAPSATLRESSDEVAATALLAEQLQAAFRGGPLTDERGEVVGILDLKEEGARATVWSTAVFRAVLAGLLRDGGIRRPSLGAHYIDLGSVVGVPEALRFSRTTGALLSGTKDEPAVAANSAAAAAGLKSGDLITDVGGQPITEEATLNTILQKYSAGDSVDVTFLRGGTAKTVKVVLQEREAGS